MTRWLQDKPRELSERLDAVSRTDLRILGTRDEARALMGAAADMIRRCILADPENDWSYSRRDRPLAALHWCWRDRITDALACLNGTARVLRRQEEGRDG